jgi:hypothetical protein
MRTKQFWLDATERAVKTAAQVAVLVIAAGDEIGFDLFSADWGDIGSMAAGGAVLSYLTSIISAPVGRSNSASVLGDVHGN